MLGDLKSVRWIHAKGWMFLAIGVLAAVLLLNDLRSLRGTLLLATCVWGFCRFYYYAFYVIEKYADPTYKFAGLGSFVRYWLRRG